MGPARLELLFAMLAATVSNGFRGMAGKRGARKLTAFMFKWDRASRRRPSPKELIAKVRSVNAALGGTEETRK